MSNELTRKRGRYDIYCGFYLASDECPAFAVMRHSGGLIDVGRLDVPVGEFWKRMREIPGETGLAAIVEPKDLPASPQQAYQLGMIRAAIEYWCMERKIPVGYVSDSRWRRILGPFLPLPPGLHTDKLKRRKWRRELVRWINRFYKRKLSEYPESFLEAILVAEYIRRAKEALERGQ